MSDRNVGSAEGFPSLDDGPPKRSWRPCVPACLGGHRPDSRAMNFSVATEDGAVHRFLLTREGMALLGMAFVENLSPKLSWLMGWWYRRQLRRSRQSDRQSGSSRVEGSMSGDGQ
jgi:hypothetical protein